MLRVLPRWMLLIHALLVLLLLAAFILVNGAGPRTDANIGAGLIGLVLLGLGLPWSLLHLLVDSSTYGDLSAAVRTVLTFGPAVFNVVVHMVFVWALERRNRAIRARRKASHR